MKIRQCFLELQLKMSGMFFETHCTYIHTGYSCYRKHYHAVARVVITWHVWIAAWQDLQHLCAKHSWFSFADSAYNECCLLLTVILTNVRQQSGPKCLINMCLSIKNIHRVKTDSSRPDVAIMLSTSWCTQLYTQRLSTSSFIDPNCTKRACPLLVWNYTEAKKSSYVVSPRICKQVYSAELGILVNYTSKISCAQSWCYAKQV